MGTTSARAAVHTARRAVRTLAVIAAAATLGLGSPASGAESSFVNTRASLARREGASRAPWASVAQLRDLSLDGARDLGPALAAAPALVTLPWKVTTPGGTYDALRVGVGWVQLIAAPGATADLDGTSAPAAELGANGPRTDVLTGPAVSLDPSAPVLARVAPDGVVIRWTSLLVAAAGGATVEVFLDASGSMTLQYLHLPQAATAAMAAKAVSAGPLEAGLTPKSASAFKLSRRPTASLGQGPPRTFGPQSTDDPPMGCTASTGTWCDDADGPGTSKVFLSETFDDGLSAARGWTASDLWHEVPYATCTPGATSNPGRSWYFGQDSTCQYLSNHVAILQSPLVGPVTAGSQFVFSSRIGYESPFDSAEVYVNGALIGPMPSTLDPSLWYNFNPISLSAWAGQMVQVQFLIQTDNTVTDLGWFIDDVIVWDPNVANPNCVIKAGHGTATPCDRRVDTQWTFNESQFCQGCTYTFYVLVECGHEMHVPLDDMEGGDLRITNMVTGAPVPLHCVNQTARADAGLGPYPTFVFPDPAGGSGCLDCCPSPTGCESWWGPAFDVEDVGGHVAWGFPGCPAFNVYDANGDGGVRCNELPGTCGGLLPRLSPGELQTMDCSITDSTGLCGLYRVDITSGGNVWSLFANCDGKSTPQFQIFHDCTEAWAAYNPLPEFAVANLVTENGCPDLDVSFDLINLGCTSYDGDVLLRVTSDCAPVPDSLDHVERGPFPPNSSRAVLLPFHASCTPVRVEVFADPDDSIAECTESISVAACKQDEGIDSLATFACGCTAQLTADAGADRAACWNSTVMLTGATSRIEPCTNKLYHWLDATGREVRGWSDDPTFSFRLLNCPAGQDYTLEVQCDGELCVDGDTVHVGCLTPSADAGPDVKACVGTPVVLDASRSTVTGCSERRYQWYDSSGMVIQPWGSDPHLDLGSLSCSRAGTYTVEVGCATGGTCSAFDDVVVSCVEVVANAGSDLNTCEDQTFTITDAGSTATGCTQVLYQWFDSSGSPLTLPSNDPKFSGSLTGCPGAVSLILVAACGDAGFETCGSFDMVNVTCPKPLAPTPTANPRCGGLPTDLHCGTPETGVTYTWDTDITTDSDGDTDPANDVDVTGCDVSPVLPAGSYTARATADAGGCRTSADVGFVVRPGVPPAETTDLRVSRSGAALTVTWNVASPGVVFRVVRGSIAVFAACPPNGRCYDHAADDAAGRGACNVATPTFTDPDDATDGGSWYYLAAGVDDCGVDGTLGSGWDGHLAFVRPPRTPSTSCP